MSNKIVSLLLVWVVVAEVASAQFSLPNELQVEKSNASTSPYLFPVNPGKPNFLSGTMGELRSTHFHAGIDVRTNNSVGLPIFATQSGYVSRVIVGPAGYGHAMMVTHPDGNTSLYGHLDQFKGAIAQYVLQQQYNKKSFSVDLLFTPDQFPVAKGDTLALSGNTGSSNGPHLHFEIRNSNNEALNPLSFGFTEIDDKLPPIAFRIALKTMDLQSRVNDRFGRFEFGLVRNGNTGKLPYPIFVNGNIGIEILAYDRLELSQYRCGINQIEMYVDSVLTFKQNIDKIDFGTYRDIVTVMDYKSLKTRGAYFNKLYVEDGNALNFFQSNKNGIVRAVEGTKNIKIIMRDFAGRESTVSFKMQFDPHTSEVPLLETYNKPIDYEIQENVMTIHSRYAGKPAKLKVYQKNAVEEVEPAYAGNAHQVFLIDLKKIRPDSVSVGNGTLPFRFKDVIPSGTDYTYYGEGIELFFPNKALYDTLYLQLNSYQKNGRAVYRIGDVLTPIKSVIQVTIKPSAGYPRSDKNSVYHIEGNRYEYVGGQIEEGKITFSPTELGEFTVLSDSIPPTIGRISITNRSARLRIRDNLSGIASYEANIDGEWLLMKYDYKTGIVQSERLDKKKFLKGMFELKVRDRVGNERVYRQRIN